MNKMTPDPIPNSSLRVLHHLGMTPLNSVMSLYFAPEPLQVSDVESWSVEYLTFKLNCPKLVRFLLKGEDVKPKSRR